MRVGISLFLTIVFSLLIWSTINDCEKLKELPDVPIYPQALLLESNTNSGGRGDYALFISMMGIRSKSRLVLLNYSSNESPQNIIDFYEAQANCEGNFEEAGRVVCTGNALPVGAYSVYIDLDANSSNTTDFILEIRWFGCGLYDEI